MEQEENRMYTDEEVNYIVKEVRDRQANQGILIALAVMGVLVAIKYLS
jgi:hypothetical protein